MLLGLVKWFDTGKGFGTIATPEEGEFFLHNSTYVQKGRALVNGDAVVFAKNFDKERNRYTAHSCRLVGEIDDWQLIASRLGKRNSVDVDVNVQISRTWRSVVQRTMPKSFNLMEIAANHFLEKKENDELFKAITDYFDERIAHKSFISYCVFIENRIKKNLSTERSNELLDRIFSYYARCSDTGFLFQAWKARKFKYIAQPDINELEISSDILKNHFAEIGISELERIQNFSYGFDFYEEFVKSRMAEVHNLNLQQQEALFPILEFGVGEYLDQYKQTAEMAYAETVLSQVIDQAGKLGVIETDFDFSQYRRIDLIIPSRLDPKKKDAIAKELDKIIISRSSDLYLPELWLKGIIEYLPYETILAKFLNTNTTSDLKIAILSKVELGQKIDLLKAISKSDNFITAFDLFERLAKKTHLDPYSFKLSEKIFDSDYWHEHPYKNLLVSFQNFTDEEASDDQKYELFIKGYFLIVPLEIVWMRRHKMNPNDFSKVFKSELISSSFVLKVLLERAVNENPHNLLWIYNLGQQYLSENDFSILDSKIFQMIDQSAYFDIWNDGKAKIFPKDHILEMLSGKRDTYSQICSWINKSIVTSELISMYLLSYLSEQIEIANQPIFDSHYSYIKLLISVSEYNIEKIEAIESPFYNIIIWHLDRRINFCFDTLKSKFIYFNGDDQVKIIRRLFRSNALGQFTLTAYKLNELTRFDLDLYQLTIDTTLSPNIDISSDVVIQALLSYEIKGRFITEREIIEIVLDDLKGDKTKRFKLSTYFENCKGRQVAKFDWSSEGEIKKVFFGEGRYYLSIDIPKEKVKIVQDRYRNKDVKYYANPNFTKLTEVIRSFPSAKWNAQDGHWGIPSKYEAIVLEFAKQYRLFLNFEGNKYAINAHLAKLEREASPEGILFCEGRKANRHDEILKSEFWWCAGRPCLSKCETIHTNEQWENYTLLDFCRILGFDLDEINWVGDKIVDGKYYNFISLINRFNILLERLYCHDCNNILHPAGTSHFAAHTVVRYKCVNESCSNREEIYLNHCLNGQCNEVIDSRISKKCKNGLFICAKCGSCCSHSMLSRRLQNLNQADIPNNGIKQGILLDLTEKVEKKLGHLERGSYFCFKCSKPMVETSDEVFHCAECNVSYDTSKFRFKRPHKYLEQS